MTGLSSYQAGVYGDLFQFMPASVLRRDGTVGPPDAIGLFGPDMFSGLINKSQTAYDSQGSSALGVNFSGNFCMDYMKSKEAMLTKEFFGRDAKGNEIRGASMSDFIDGMRNGRMS
jgi:hypothetical protein